MTPEGRLQELQSRLIARDVFEYHVLSQVVLMPKDTAADQEARLVAWHTAMRQAPDA